MRKWAKSIKGNLGEIPPALEDSFYTADFFDFFFVMYVLQNCFICRPADSIVSEDAGIVPRTFATLALTAARRSYYSARSHPLGGLLPNTQSSAWPPLESGVLLY
jgi:hypothetical protein